MAVQRSLKNLGVHRKALSSYTLRLVLERRWVSAVGAESFLAGEIIPWIGDRQKIARVVSRCLAIHAEKNQDIEVENDETHWVGHDRVMLSELRQLGISFIGVQQFFSAQPVSSPQDRAFLSGLYQDLLGALVDTSPIYLT